MKLINVVVIELFYDFKLQIAKEMFKIPGNITENSWKKCGNIMEICKNSRKKTC